MRIGFIGLGRMGRPMATRLLAAGHQVLVHDVTPAAVEALAAQGAARAASAAEVANEVETVLVSLPTPSVVEQVLTGPDGLACGAKVRTVVDLSTTGPTVSARAAGVLGERGISLVDAPVSGGTPGAEAGTLAIMASGEAAAFAAVKPLLQAIGSNIFYLGPAPGQGQTMKIVNNMLCAAAAMSAMEALVLGAKAGLEAQTMLDVINVSSGRSFATEVKIPQCIADRSFPLRFSTELLHKDVSLCIQEAERLGVPMWVNQMVRQFLQFGLSQGLGQKDYAEMIKLIEGWAGAEFGGRPQQEGTAAT
jgi:3-hydroxyisobutyrate dehydrogenase